MSVEVKNKCVHWGENKPEEYFFDVGCTIGYSFCKIKNCEDYRETDKSFSKAINELVRVVLLDDRGTEKARRLFKEKFGFGDMREYIKVTAERNNITEEQARKRILCSPTLLQIAFILA